MRKIPTIRVKHKIFKYEMVINESDFDKNLHEKITAKVEKPVNEKKEKNVDEELKALMGA